MTSESNLALEKTIGYDGGIFLHPTFKRSPMVIPRYLLFTLLCLLAIPARAAPPLSAQVDRLVEAQAPGKLAGVAEDAEFLRRVWLDLAGIVPPVDQVRAFLADKGRQKREKVIDQLLSSEEYPRRMREAFTVMLLERRTGATVPDEEWNSFLESSFGENKPWDQFARELIQADGADEKTRGSVKFFTTSGRTSHDQMTQDVGRLLLGMNIHCAKCHDHPNVEQYKQADYFGLLAFLNQSTVAKHGTLQKSFLVEKVATGKLDFESVFFPGEKKQSGPRLPGGEEVEIPTFEKGEEFSEPAANGLPGVPKFRPRQLLAEKLTAATNRRFVQNSVNRFWFLMMGRGLVEPLDMLHDANPASHPELMTLLSDEFVAHQFDVKWLLRELALSETYQRSSVFPKGVTSKDAPPHSYQVANARGLTPEQMAWSMMRVTGVLERIVRTPRPEDSAFTFKDYINGRIPAPDNLADTMLLFTSVFGNPPGEAEVEFQPSMGQALFLMNEQLVLDWLKPSEGNLVDRLVKLEDAKKITEELYLQVLGRFPLEEEVVEVVTHLEENRERFTEAISEYAWALVTSAEFKLNH